MQGLSGAVILDCPSIAIPCAWLFMGVCGVCGLAALAAGFWPPAAAAVAVFRVLEKWEASGFSAINVASCVVLEPCSVGAEVASGGVAAVDWFGSMAVVCAELLLSCSPSVSVAIGLYR